MKISHALSKPVILWLSLLLYSCSEQVPSSAFTKPTQDTVSSAGVNSLAPTLAYSSLIRAIYEDRKGNLWIGSDREGVCRYDGETFSYFTTADGLSDMQIRRIAEDEHGHLWFDTGHGLSRYDGEKFTVQRADAQTAPSVSPPPGAAVSNGWQHQRGDLWFNGELEGGVYRFDGTYLHLLQLPALPPGYESFSLAGGLTGVSQTEDDMLWLASYEGVIGFDGSSFHFINQPGINYHVRDLLADSKGNLWIGNNGIGVLRYDGNETVALADLLPKDTAAVPLRVFAIAEDKEGHIWFGDRDSGAWRYDGQSLRHYTAADGLTNLTVREIYRDRNGEMWFGLEDGQVMRFKDEQFVRMF